MSKLSNTTVATLIEAMGMFIHDLDILCNHRENEGVYTQGAYDALVTKILESEEE